jgi:hypothetical protein
MLTVELTERQAGGLQNGRRSKVTGQNPSGVAALPGRATDMQTLPVVGR